MSEPRSFLKQLKLGAFVIAFLVMVGLGVQLFVLGIEWWKADSGHPRAKPLIVARVSQIEPDLESWKISDFKNATVITVVRIVAGGERAELEEVLKIADHVRFPYAIGDPVDLPAILNYDIRDANSTAWKVCFYKGEVPRLYQRYAVSAGRIPALRNLSLNALRSYLKTSSAALEDVVTPKS